MKSREGAKVDRWRLDSVTLTDFRGIVGTTEYRFAALLALIWGENGVGKSTLALGLEWTLFGGFRSNALGSPRPSFMSPVGSASKGCKGEVVFTRGSERLVVRRDDEEDEFEVDRTGAKSGTNEEATALLQDHKLTGT